MLERSTADSLQLLASCSSAGNEVIEAADTRLERCSSRHLANDWPSRCRLAIRGLESPMRASQMGLGESAVFFLQHSRTGNLWYYSKWRCNVRERSAITPERKARNSCGMTKNPRRSPLLTVLSVARGKTG